MQVGLILIAKPQIVFNSSVLTAWFTLCLCCILLNVVSEAQAHTDSAGLSPFKQVAYFVDETDALTEQDVISGSSINWIESSTHNMNLGFISHTLWVKLVIPAGSKTGNLFEIANQRINQIQLFVVEPDVAKPENQWHIQQQFKTAETVPVAERFYTNRFFVFPLELNADNDSVVLLKINNKNPGELTPGFLV